MGEVSCNSETGSLILGAGAYALGAILALTQGNRSVCSNMVILVKWVGCIVCNGCVWWCHMDRCWYHAYHLPPRLRDPAYDSRE
ncbi:hypothetical protein SPFM15_00084 [Salmonella phage SPFM15]|nr:hypothetical protein SPFM5_00079 [Salmonella phage SPFM5]VFR13708.1 hypothetical protein SPFM15_00084 [Salmonella phage SPFM15]